MKKLFFVLFILLLACSATKKDSPNARKKTHHLVLLHVVNNLKTPESVMYYPDENVFFVSNVNGNPSAFDNNGFISKIKDDGKIVKLKWVRGLNAPKGMGIVAGNLFVTDINRVAQIDIKKDRITKFFNIPNSKFLNDIATDENGNIYISDMGDNKIYLIKNNKVTILLDHDLNSPNGLLYRNKVLYIGNNNNILAYDTKNNTDKIICKNTGNIDGLKFIDDSTFIISDWTGNVNIVSGNCKKTLILSTANKKINAADFEFVQQKKLLLIPTFFNNKVDIYQLF